MKTITYDETKFKLVPIEPTEEMLLAMRTGNLAFYKDDECEAYQDMLNAAPAAEEAPGQDESAYQRGYMDGMAKPCPDCADYKAMYLKVRDELAELQQHEPVISTKHGPWIESKHPGEEGESYCQRCLLRDKFLGSRECEPHIEVQQHATHGEPVAFKQFLSDVHTAAGLVAHGKQSKALSERLGEGVMRYLTSPKPDTHGEPVAWLVCSVNSDGSLSLEHAAPWEEAAHEHINDAITEHDIEDAASWVVRPAYTSPQPAPDLVQAARQALEALQTQHVEYFMSMRLRAITALQNALKGTT